MDAQVRRVSSFWPKTPRFTRFFGVSERRRRRFPGSAPAALLPVGTLLRKPWCFWPEIRILPRRPPSCLVGSRLALVLFRSVPPCAAPHPPRTPAPSRPCSRLSLSPRPHLPPPVPASSPLPRLPCQAFARPHRVAPAIRPLRPTPFSLVPVLALLSHTRLAPPHSRVPAPSNPLLLRPAKPSPGLASLSAPRLPSSRTHLLIPPLTALCPAPRSIPHTFDDFATRRRPSCPSSTGGRPHFPRWASAAARFVAGEGLSDARPGGADSYLDAA